MNVSNILRLPKKTLCAFLDHDCPAQAAALAYYTVFSLPPLLVVAVATAALQFERSTVVSTIYTEVHATLGPHVAQQLVDALAAAQRSTESGSALIGFLILGFSASGAFNQLQSTLNRVWEVKPDPDQSEIRSFFVKRMASFGMVMSVGFLLTASLLVSAALASLSMWVYPVLPGGLSAGVWRIFTEGLSFCVFGALFAAIFRVLPDAEIQWKDVLPGGLITSGLFLGGRLVLGRYLASTDATNAYGAAASLALILLWTYYASMILLLGAEFTRSWSQRERPVSVPEPGAVRVKQQEVRLG